MACTRVLLVDMPQMLREIVRGLVSAEPDMEVVGEVSERVPSLEAVQASGAQFVIAGGAGPELATACKDLLRKRPDIGVLVLATDARSGALYERRDGTAREAHLGEIAPERLVAVIRGAMRGDLTREGS